MKKSICLIVILFLFTFVYSADLKFDGSNKIKTGSLVKGLVGHWMLDSESEKKFSSAYWDGDNDLVNCGSDSSIDDIFDGGGTASAWIKAESDGETSCGQIMSKTSGWWFFVAEEAAGKIKISLYKDFSTTGGRWITTNTVVTIGTWAHVAVSYDSDSADNNPTIYVNGIAYTIGDGLTEQTTPVGTRTSDAAVSMHLGNTASKTVTFDGSMTDMRLYDETKSAADIAILANKGNINRPVVQTDLVAWYPLNDYDDHSTNTNDGTNDGTTMTQNTAADLTPYGNTGTVYGTNYTTDQKGQSNRAMSFDGEDDYISITDTDDLSFGNGTSDSPFSVSAWVNMDDASSFVIASKGIRDMDGEWSFRLHSDGKVRFVLYDLSNTSRIGKLYNTPLTSYEGTWIHLVGTYDGRGGASANDGITIYLNSIDTSAPNFQTNPYVAMENLDQDVWIGKYGSSYADGKIDEVCIYNKALSQAEITLLYESYRPYFIMSGE